MKIRNRILMAALAISTSFSLYSCEKDDSTANVSQVTTYAVINITGDEIVTVAVGDTYTDEGATAENPSTGAPISVTSSGTVDTSTPGQYTIEYTAINEEGFPATATRIVNVLNTGTIFANLAGTYVAPNGVEATVTQLSQGYYQMSEADARLPYPIPVTLLNTQGSTLEISGNTVYGRIAGTGRVGSNSSATPPTIAPGDTLILPLVFLDQGPITRTQRWIKQ